MKDNRPTLAGTILTALTLSLATPAFSQVHPTEKHRVDTIYKPILHEPRFIIVQSPAAVRATFKLDTYFGSVYQLQVDSSGRELWQLLRRSSGALMDIAFPNTTNYNLFVSSVGLRFTYLFNVNTGVSWILVQDPKTKENSFELMEDKY